MVQEGADARFDEVIERLLFLLDTEPRKLIWKWKQTGLMAGIDDDFVAQTLAEKLEEEAHKIIDWIYLETPDTAAIDKATGRLYEIRKEVMENHERQRNYFTNKYGMRCSVCRGN